MKYIFNLAVLLLGLFFIGGFYVRSTLFTPAAVPTNTKESRAGVGTIQQSAPDCEQERDAALAAEKQAQITRDSLWSQLIRLGYQHEDLKIAHEELQAALLESKSKAEDLQTQLSNTKELLSVKKDSLHSVQQQYFDKCDLNELLIEENESLRKKLEWHQHKLPKLTKWLAALTLLLLAVTGGLLVHIQQRQQ